MKVSNDYSIDRTTSAHFMSQSHFAIDRLKSRKSILLYIPPLDVSAVPVLLRQSPSGCVWMMCLAETTQVLFRDEMVSGSPGYKC